MEYGDLYIISGVNRPVDYFHKKVSFGHFEGIKEFVNINQLEYSFRDDDYQEAPCILSLDGYLVIKTIESAGVLICYLPEYVTDEQNMWLFEHSDLFRKFSIVAGYQIKQDGDTYKVQKVHGMNEIMQQLNRGNVLYHQMKISSKSEMKR